MLSNMANNWRPRTKSWNKYLRQQLTQIFVKKSNLEPIMRAIFEKWSGLISISTRKVYQMVPRPGRVWVWLLTRPAPRILLPAPPQKYFLGSAPPRTKIMLPCASLARVSGNSRSRLFPRMKASDSLSRIMGIDFFHSLPVPKFRECFFFIPFPFPKYGNGFFSFPSCSRIVGMDFF